MKTKSVWCRECDHEHECEVVSEEYDEWVDVPDVCEACGEPLRDGGLSDDALRGFERRQMGACG